ncbi:PqqD family protein [Aurantiacibacter sp. MUD61]|uniref:PqqD family protein n=1 Tax=Aurantiacibacter sp. MUD61 TaxID=3009083 RepID=UPI0022F0890C|nr:PqqD family protein [Aurantiacibacter sp. MUD61]
MDNAAIEKDKASYRKTDVFVESNVDDTLILMHLEDSKFLTLEKSARRIWELLDENPTVSEICDKLTDEFNVEGSTCRDQTSEFLESLAARGLVERCT